MSNIQALSHINQSKTAHIISFLKNEIKFGTIVNEENKHIKTDVAYCKNELTGITYSFMKGTPEERGLYRVMPMDGEEKIYFDSKDEYVNWSKRNKRRRK